MVDSERGLLRSPAWRGGRRRGSDCPLAELVTEQVQELLGREIRQVVGDFELADTGGEAVAEITGTYPLNIDYPGLSPPEVRVEVEHVE